MQKAIRGIKSSPAMQLGAGQLPAYVVLSDMAMDCTHVCVVHTHARHNDVVVLPDPIHHTRCEAGRKAVHS